LKGASRMRACEHSVCSAQASSRSEKDYPFHYFAGWGIEPWYTVSIN
jgi:hypothetical protein